MRNLKELSKKGFKPRTTAEVFEIHIDISPYPQRLICRWWAENAIGEKLLIEEKILECKE